MTSGAVIDATDASFQRDVIERSREVPVVVDFWATWCEPCRVLGPILEQLAEEYDGRVQLVKVDTDANQMVAMQNGIRSIPAVKAFRDGELVDEFVGALPEPHVREFFERIQPSEADALAEQGDLALDAGDLDAARTHFEAARALQPDHEGATLGLAAVLVEQGEVDAAEELALRHPGDRRSRIVLARAGLLRAAVGVDRPALEARLAANEDDIEARYLLGAQMVAVGEWEPGFEQLLEVVIRDRAFADDGARLRILDGLELLGAQHPLTEEYRRRLTNVLF
jgi:putative thioredoxin